MLHLCHFEIHDLCLLEVLWGPLGGAASQKKAAPPHSERLNITTAQQEEGGMQHQPKGA